MKDLTHLLNHRRQQTYYLNPTKAALRNILYPYLIDIIVNFTVDTEALAFGCVGTFEGSGGRLVNCFGLGLRSILSNSFCNTIKV